MQFTLSIDLENDAFQEAPGFEIARIMNRLGSRLVDHPDLTSTGATHQGSVHDKNGNRVGLWSVEEGK